MMNEKEVKMYDEVIELGICTTEELNLVKNAMGGTWEFVINRVVSVRTEYDTLEQYIKCELEEEE